MASEAGRARGGVVSISHKFAIARREHSRALAFQALAEAEADLKRIRLRLVAGEPITGSYGTAMQRLQEACGGFDAAIAIIETMEVTS